MRRPELRRSAFTLTELLVVIALIVVLGALGMGAASKGYGWVKQRSTETTMTKVIQRLQKRIDQIYKEAEDWPSDTETLIFQQAGGSFERAYVLKVLYLYKWSFPNTYAEAVHNVQESRVLYRRPPTVTGAETPAELMQKLSQSGYPPARALLGALRKGCSSIPDPYAPAGAYNPNLAYPLAWPGGTPVVTDIATVIPKQSAACLLAAYIAANGSADDFNTDEIAVSGSVVGDNNKMLVDAWGTPYLFLRHGNFIHGRHTFGGGAPTRSAWWMGMVIPGGVAALDFSPLEYILNPQELQPPPLGPSVNGVQRSYYFQQIQRRASTAYPSLSGRDPFDPTQLLKNNSQWRTNTASNANGSPIDGWLIPTAAFAAWLPPTNQAGNAQYATYFRCTFGYMPEAGPTQGIPNQAYTPMLILSAGGDKQFFNWDDNLDSYRLQVNVPSQQ